VTECWTGGMCAASAMSGIAAFSRLNVCDEMRRRDARGTSMNQMYAGMVVRAMLAENQY